MFPAFSSGRKSNVSFGKEFALKMNEFITF